MGKPVDKTGGSQIPQGEPSDRRAIAQGRESLVLGGNGWKLRDFYTGGGLEKHLAYARKVDILTLESFVARANQGKL